MRRIAAVFSSSKRDKSVSASAPSQSSAQNTARRSFTNLSLSRKRNIKASVDTAGLPPSVDSIPSTPQLSTGQSSGSSTGSASLQTHDEVTLPSPRRAKGKLWISWLGKRTDTIKPNERTTPETGWSSPPASRRPHLADGLPLGIETGSETSESDEEQEEEEEEEEVEFSHNISDARQVLQVLTQNGLQHQFHSSPFIQRQASSIYPRSCNPSRMLRKQATVETLLHKRRLLKRLLEPLTEQEAASLRPLQLKKVQALPVTQEPADEAAPHKTDKISGFSSGLRKTLHMAADR
ncbi:hypothetical protein L218DRAFT_970239 [Marasmius fiardii PR-910]|nr:hypothetical protein L218DRAFT_970239 [Marasmius fiardii PR-910]